MFLVFLNQYLAALGYTIQLDSSAFSKSEEDEAIYLKFNTPKMPDLTPSTVVNSLSQNLALLKSYSCLTVKVPASTTEKEALQQAIIQVCQASEYENLGICADRLDVAITTLNEYLAALGYTGQLDSSIFSESKEHEPIYLKFNTQKMSHYSDRYEGTYRGVLIACQSEDQTLAGTYGYFPLDLFAPS